MLSRFNDGARDLLIERRYDGINLTCRSRDLNYDLFAGREGGL